MAAIKVSCLQWIYFNSAHKLIPVVQQKIQEKKFIVGTTFDLVWLNFKSFSKEPS